MRYEIYCHRLLWGMFVVLLLMLGLLAYVQFNSYMQRQQLAHKISQLQAVSERFLVVRSEYQVMSLPSNLSKHLAEYRHLDPDKVLGVVRLKK